MEEKSKTQKKKDALALQDLGGRLVKLPEEILDDMDLPAELREAVAFAKTIRSRSALKRQMQYIGSLMRKIDTDPVREALSDIDRGRRRMALSFRETETWRDELIAGNTELMDDILRTCPGADRQHLSQLVRNAVKEHHGGRPGKAYRALFRYLREIKKQITEREAEQ